MRIKINTSSFRDPSGFLFYHDDDLYRQINENYSADYKLLRESGLYDRLVNENLLISHKEIDYDKFTAIKAYKIIKPERISFISYPYEWSFSELKDAALSTLKIQKIALEFGMSLKDASAYNIQFHKGKPIFIDTLSFETYQKGTPWKAYKQFCQHFFAPLALMSHTDTRLNQLLRIYIDGVPLDLASKLLGIKTRLTPTILVHIHLHSKSQKKYENIGTEPQKKLKKMNFLGLMGLIDNLESAINRLTYEPSNTEWSEYYTFTNYSENAFEHKKNLTLKFIETVKPKTVWDFGANEGMFSRLSSARGINTISFDMDAAAVEKNYTHAKKNNDSHILPLLLDLTNPSPGIGWMNLERESLLQRTKPDLLLALALIHHLAISNNLPFEQIASFFHKISKYLVIEFIPKEDSQVQKLLLTRQDIFSGYDLETFIKKFSFFYNILESSKITGSERTLHFMERK